VELDLNAIEARLAAASPGPWNLDSSLSAMFWHNRWIWPGEPGYPNVVRHWRLHAGKVYADSACEGWPQMQHDMEFIAHSYDDIAALIAEVRRLRGQTAASLS
jgi:hypothetical protein